MADVKNILMVGVGGQGTILASKIMTTVLLDAGYDVKMSEIHGMAQRGGSVSSQIRFGDKVFSPIIGKGKADFLVSFESMEALRWLEYLNPDGKAIVNDYRIPSSLISSGKMEYPNDVLDVLKSKADVLVVKASELAKEVGDSKTMNTILLGVLAKCMKLDCINWKLAIETNVKKQMLELNLEAFNKGVNIGSQR